VARRIDAACREWGFFSVVGHGIPAALLADLDRLAREFFALDDAEKAEIAMSRGGRAWRGWFPLGGELTSGRPDDKEGVYFGAELGADDSRVRAGLPLHGPNLFPRRPPALRTTVLACLASFSALGHRIMEGIAVGLGLDADFFEQALVADPTILFRIFRYPAVPALHDGWGVGEHTDYGLLTLLYQDSRGGLEVRGPRGWVAVPAVPGALVCNIGDMLDRLTEGRYRATPHRVRSPGGTDRIACPFFFDPAWEARVEALPLDGLPPADDAATRWDGTSLRELRGTYGDYLLGKVARVFPELLDEVLPDPTVRP
jgi:isopenicillin N synthase-like dioxygenase